MSIRKATAKWNGTLKEGNGEMNFSNYNGPFTFASRFEEGNGTNPEELVAAAQAGCYSMFLSALISKQDLSPQSIDTTVSVKLEKDDTGPCITNISIVCRVKCDGLSQETFAELSATAKEKCPISRLYNGSTATIDLDASLES